MTKPLVSIIIPVYNTGKYIQRCCESLFCQTLDNLEFVFVNDGSTDDSVNTIRECLGNFPSRVPQAKIIDRAENRGISYSRQEGLDNATGEFVIHCDSDDWVELDMYQTLYNIAIKESADIVCCGFYNNYPDAQTQSSYPKTDFFQPLEFNISPLTGSLCNKLVKRSILVDNKIHFPLDTNWGEDFCVSIEGLISASYIVCIRASFYHYRQNLSSTTHNLTIAKCQELIRVGYHVEKFLDETGKRSEYNFQLNYLKFQLKAPLLMFSECRSLQLWKNVYGETKGSFFKYNCPFYLRLTAWLIDNGMSFCASIVLFVRDIVSKIKNS